MRKLITIFVALVFCTAVAYSGNEVSSQAIIDQINASKNVSYEGKTIKGELNLNRLDNMEVRQKNAVHSLFRFLGIGNDTTKQYVSTIDEDIYFKNCVFEKGVYGYKQISNDTYNTNFEGTVKFVSCDFKGDSEFKYCKFNDKVDFSGSNFTKEANFKYAKFHNSAQYKNAKFMKDADFKYSEFYSTTDFKETIFSEKGNFKYAKFIDRADFSESVIQRQADFKYAKFKHSIDFENTAVNKVANFKYTNFRESNFKGTEFGEANFKYAKFHGQTDLSNVVINGNADFKYTDFDKDVKLDNLEIKGKSRFEYAKVGDRSFTSYLLESK